MGIKFRLIPGLFREMQKSLAHSVAVEQGCFLLCSEAKANGDHILIANELIPLEKSDASQETLKVPVVLFASSSFAIFCPKIL